MRIRRVGKVELRFEDKLDEVVLLGEYGSDFHMEYMDTNLVWFRAGGVHVNLKSSGPITASVYFDDENEEPVPPPTAASDDITSKGADHG